MKAPPRSPRLHRCIYFSEFFPGISDLADLSKINLNLSHHLAFFGSSRSLPLLPSVLLPSVFVFLLQPLDEPDLTPNPRRRPLARQDYRRSHCSLLQLGVCNQWTIEASSSTVELHRNRGLAVCAEQVSIRGGGSWTCTLRVADARERGFACRRGPPGARQW
jgi:hypothetical protein